MIDARTAPYGALLLRVASGALFIAHALTKLLVFTIPGTMKFFASVGFPGWLAYVAIAIELIGGAGLILGVYVRPIAVVLGVELLVIAFAVHWKNGWVFVAKGGGWEYPMFWAAAMFTLALVGDGAFAMGPSGKRRA
ncbi:MAG: DoxX family protein [Burkholderiales bacterium]